MTTRKILPANDDLLQALRNVTREYMRLRAKASGISIEDTRTAVCVSAALEQLQKHEFKQANHIK